MDNKKNVEYPNENEAKKDDYLKGVLGSHTRVARQYTGSIARSNECPPFIEVNNLESY